MTKLEKGSRTNLKCLRIWPRPIPRVITGWWNKCVRWTNGSSLVNVLNFCHFSKRNKTGGILDRWTSEILDITPSIFQRLGPILNTCMMLYMPLSCVIFFLYYYFFLGGGGWNYKVSRHTCILNCTKFFIVSKSIGYFHITYRHPFSRDKVLYYSIYSTCTMASLLHNTRTHLFHQPVTGTGQIFPRENLSQCLGTFNQTMAL